MNIKPVRLTIHGLFLLSIILLVSCLQDSTTTVPTSISEQTASSETYWPTKSWRTSTPEEQGMESEKLAQMLDKVQQQQLQLHSLLIVRHGYLVSESYFEIYGPETRHELYSCTKSFTSTLIGIAIDKGFIDRSDHLVMDFFPEQAFNNLDQQKKEMTLEDLLTMRSGLDWEEGDPTYLAMYQSADWVKYVLDLPMAFPPGSHFTYCSGCSHVLSAIVRQATGMNPMDYAEQNLFGPLGISNKNWDTDAEGIPIGGWGLQLTPRDMVKLGYLFLHDGEWDGNQIISRSWIENATLSHTGTEGDLGYGYQWWTFPSPEGYAALGRYGQMIAVIPGSDLVIVTTAQMDNHDDIFELIEQYILPALQETQ